jgi:putative phosphoribosyl transferase
VLALPRGGVPVALEVARALAAPLDLVMVRKLGVPVQPELAAGAVVNGDHPQIVVNADVMRQARLGREDLDRIAASELEEIRRRRLTYLKDRAQVPVAGRTAIIVDDGIATGATVRAAIRGTRQRGPTRLVVAVPVAAPDTIDSIAADGDVDDVVCPLTPDFFYAIGAHYDDFRQLGDDEVVRLIAEADRLAAPDPAPPGNG